MAGGVEREIKIRFGDPATARAAVLASGATPARPRRLQQDCLLDTPAGLLRSLRSALRVRSENGAAVLTYKGPVQMSAMKVREEIETHAQDPALLLKILERVGFRVWFRYEKFREEFTRGDDVIVAVDETPIGTFIEIEGSEQGVIDCAAALDIARDDVIVDSYRGLFVRYCEEHSLEAGDMLFDV
jgi:adenylate cyclase class 2